MEDPNKGQSLFSGKLGIINVGIEKLAEHLSYYDVDSIHVEWSPPAGGNLDMLRKLRKLMQT